VAGSVAWRDGLRRSQHHLRELIDVHTAVHPAEAGAVCYARLSSDSFLDRPAAARLTRRSVPGRQVVLDTMQDQRQLLATRRNARRSPLPLGKPMAIGHLIVAFDDKRASATFVWPGTGEVMKITYVETVDRAMHLMTEDHRRITLPLGKTVEPVPGVRMKFYERGARRVRIEAPRNIRIVR